jgi:hypothetical protein
MRCVLEYLDALAASAFENEPAGDPAKHQLPRDWRIIHFMSVHSAVNAEKNLGHFGHAELGLGRAS